MVAQTCRPSSWPCCCWLAFVSDSNVQFLCSKSKSICLVSTKSMLWCSNSSEDYKVCVNGWVLSKCCKEVLETHRMRQTIVGRRLSCPLSMCEHNFGHGKCDMRKHGPSICHINMFKMTHYQMGYHKVMLATKKSVT